MFRTLLTITLLCACASGHAQIYKWADAQGRIHYTDNKDDAGEAPVAELKMNGEPTVLPAPPSNGPSWQQRDAEFKRRQQYKLLAPNYRPRQQAAPQQASVRQS
ncbi:DUF4124 domain-containing protein [Duganella violaceipulchra]|uniref:DUF4124 domain-containing protein n=1 Tax=Duganella violaceipulchra TaxID=2849652 RepID=A0AA41H4B6_9BURK|nr:DUF4124 domain-containing protein [Duganella violaceicalia]MBV6321168.1 DUF4124 domain-containing protein [Duganella violaceicalia]MCP2009586.1 hypothetical protein [Duganella violaceicalia]